MLPNTVEHTFVKAAQAIARRNADNFDRLKQSITILYHTGLKQYNKDVPRITKIQHSVQLCDAIMIGVFSILSGASDLFAVDLAGSEHRMALGLGPAPIISPGQR